MSQSVATRPRQTSFLLTLLFVLIVTALCIWIILNPRWVAAFQTWGYIGAFVLNVLASATLVLPVPGAALVIAMSTALNPWWLSAVSGVGSAFGELTGYFAGAGGTTLVPASQQPTFDRIHRLTEKYGAYLLFALAAFPFPLFDVAGIVAGATRMKIWKFLIATALGKTVKYGFLIVVGAGPLELLQQWLQLRG